MRALYLILHDVGMVHERQAQAPALLADSACRLRLFTEFAVGPLYLYHALNGYMRRAPRDGQRARLLKGQRRWQTREERR
mgnify:CR=1 FL=1